MSDRVIPDAPGLWWYDVSGEPGALGDRREQVVDVYRVRGEDRLWFVSPVRRKPMPIEQADGEFLCMVPSRSDVNQGRADLAWALCIVHLVDVSGMIAMVDRQRERLASICKRLDCDPESASAWTRISDMANAEGSDGA